MVTEMKEYNEEELSKMAEADKLRSEDNSTPAKETPSKQGKKPASKGDKNKSTPETADGPNQFPTFDPNEPNKHKVTPDCAHIDLSQMETMSEMLKYFLHADNLDEEHQFALVINDCQVDSQAYTEIVDLAIGLGAKYLNLKGCSKVEKYAKVERFCEIKSEQFKLL